MWVLRPGKNLTDYNEEQDELEIAQARGIQSVRKTFQLEMQRVFLEYHIEVPGDIQFDARKRR